MFIKRTTEGLLPASLQDFLSHTTLRVVFSSAILRYMLAILWPVEAVSLSYPKLHASYIVANRSD